MQELLKQRKNTSEEASYSNNDKNLFFSHPGSLRNLKGNNFEVFYFYC